MVSTGDGSNEAQLLNGLWDAAGLSFLVSGPGPIEELVALIQSRAPGLKGQPFGPHGLLDIIHPDLRAHAGFLAGPRGSAFTLIEATTNGDANIDLLMSLFPARDFMATPVPCRSGAGQWTTDIVTLGSVSVSDRGVERLVAEAKVVPFDDFDGFLRSDAEPRPRIPHDLYRTMVTNGWNEINEPNRRFMLGTNVDTGGGRTQVVFFGTPGAGEFRISSAVAADEDRFRAFEASSIEVPEAIEITPSSPEAPRATASLVWHGSPPDLETVNHHAIELAGWADAVENQLWGDDLL